MNRIFTCTLMAALGMTWSGCASPSSAETVPAHVLPSPFADYEILSGSQSPNGKFAVIYPKRDKLIEILDRGTDRLALVALSPFCVLCDIPRGSSALTLGHGSYAFEWMPDSSAFLMVQGIKWGADRVYLAELGDPNKPVLADLAALVAKRVRPAFKASKKPKYNDTFDFIFDVEDRTSSTGGWEFTRSGNVAIDCTCTNNPKPGAQDVWKLHWRGLWSRRDRTLKGTSVVER